jgi:peptidyl-tRNA hydrolase
MSIGKTAAQTAHASQLLTQKYFQLKQINQGSTPNDFAQIELFDQWIDTGYRKVVLTAGEKEWLKLKELSNNIVVVDLGLTELPINTETIIGFFPMLKINRPNVLKRLQTFK